MLILLIHLSTWDAFRAGLTLFIITEIHDCLLVSEPTDITGTHLFFRVVRHRAFSIFLVPLIFLLRIGFKLRIRLIVFNVLLLLHHKLL